MYEYTNEQIESRVLANCNCERLKEHRQCDYCHLCFDCKAYKERMGIDLCKFLINKSSQPNDVVLDCFMGSGTTGVACQELNRNFIGIELYAEYYEMAKQRIKNII